MHDRRCIVWYSICINQSIANSFKVVSTAFSDIVKKNSHVIISIRAGLLMEEGEGVAYVVEYYAKLSS